MRRKYNALEVMRLFAFFNVFWLHTGWFHFFNYYESAAWAVSFFFTLSGFLYGNKFYYIEKVALKDTINFSLKRVKKIYPLHFITLLCMVPYSQVFIFNAWDDYLKNWLIRFLTNCFLIQSWSQDGLIYYSFNGVAWFLSDMMFLTIITIPLVIVIKKFFFDKKKLIVTWIFTILCAFLWMLLVKKLKLDPGYWLYIFPPARIFEYLAGILLGMFFANQKEKREKNKFFWTLIEVILLVGLIVSFKYIEQTEYAWRSIAWIVPNCVLIYVYACEHGYFTKIVLNNKILVHLGGLTFEAYIIHQVVNIYFSNAIGAVDGLPFITRFKAEIFIILLVFLIAEMGTKRLKNRD